MYDELLKDLREKAELLTAAEPMGIKNAFADTMTQAADVIEELNKPKWIKFETRELDPDEKKDHPDWCYIMDCQLPDDGQEIFVSNGRWVWADTFCNDTNGCYLEGAGDLQGLWWMPLPEPPKEESNG